ncbi:MAG: class I SAM-dependent methyltransferase [Actinomycetota bacterium]
MNLWRGSESRSGPGSSLDETAAVRAELPRIVDAYGIRSVLDIPCGDFFWMKEVPLEIAYIGGDVVKRIVDDNNRRYGSDRRRFIRLDLRVYPLPRVDLVLCRDILDHLSFSDIHGSIDNVIRSGATYLIATTYPERDANEDIRSGDWRPVNLQREPFRLPDPIELINERSRKPGYSDKSLGLWRVAHLPRGPG